MAKQAKAIDVDETRGKLHAMMNQLASTFVKRESAIAIIVLAWLSRQHYLLVGDPGTAKSALARCAFSHVSGARYFETLMGKFTPPDQVFGPVDIAAFQQGRWSRVTDGARPMLPAVELAFLDEGLKCSDAMLNEMLGILNERVYDGAATPLLSCGMATNWPEVDARTEHIAALYDRLLLRGIVEDVQDEAETVALLAAVERVQAYRPDPAATLSVPELNAAHAAVAAVEVPVAIRAKLHDVRRRLGPDKHHNRKGVLVSSRRLGQLQTVLKAAAWLSGRSSVSIEDFSVLQYGLWNDRADYEQVVAVLQTIDATEVREVIGLIDRGRAAYNDLSRSGFGAAKVNEVTETIKGIVIEVRERLGQPVFTEKGRADIAKAMGALKENFKELNRRARQG